MDPKKRTHLVCTGLLLAAFALAVMGVTLKADEAATEAARAFLEPLITQAKLPATWDAKVGAFRIPFQGPDVWVTVAGEHVWVRSYLAELPTDANQDIYRRLLGENYQLYRGKYSVDSDLGVWFELATPKRLVDAEELTSAVACVSYAADQGLRILNEEDQEIHHSAPAAGSADEAQAEAPEQASGPATPAPSPD